MMMTFDEVIQQRRSIRDFTDQDISDALMQTIISDALSAPSSSNTQGYRIAIAKGETKNALKTALTEKFVKASALKRKPLPQKVVQGLLGGVLPDGDFKPDINYPPELKKRAIECGAGLYDTLGIARDDYSAREQQMKRNFEFFDAPVELFLFVHGDRGVYSALDGGMFLQTLMLSASAHGLGSCAQASVAMWGGTVRKYFDVGRDYKLICGLSLGYPTDAVVNNFRPNKRSVEELCLPER